MRNGAFQERKPRASTNTKVGLRMRALASGVIESSSFETGDQQAPSVQSITSIAVHSRQPHLDHSCFSLSHIDSSAKKHPSPLHLDSLHNRQHGFGGNYDCVRLACHVSYHFLLLTPFTVSTTARAAETATTYLRDGMPKQTPPTSSSNTRHKPTPNPQSAS
jgi:hypothetical protein